jgi:lipopolysaccharide kinase (Kdo/WaaP) family protein
LAEYESFTFRGGHATARRDVAGAVKSALESHGTLYGWAAAQPAHDVFTGRGAAFGVTLGPLRAVVRHARRGGLMAPLLRDLFAGEPRFRHEIGMAERLTADAVETPAVLAGVSYPVGPLHRADVATERVEGSDLASLLFGAAPPEGTERDDVLRAVGRLVRRLHVAGYVHPDLQLRNVLVTAPPRRAVLLDVDTCRDASDAATRRDNLARFYRSWDKWNRLQGPRLTDHDRLTFEEGYAEATA